MSGWLALPLQDPLQPSDLDWETAAQPVPPEAYRVALPRPIAPTSMAGGSILRPPGAALLGTRTAKLAPMTARQQPAAMGGASGSSVLHAVGAAGAGSSSGATASALAEG